MPSLIPFIPLIAGAMGVAGSALASGSKTTTQTPTLSPSLQGGQDAAMANLTSIVKDPMAGLGPIQQGAQDSINQSYKTLPNIVTQMLAARGMGSSGAVGTGTYDTEGARLGSLSSLYSQMASLGSNRQLTADQIINSMIGTGKGLATTTPNNSLAAGLMTGANDLSSFGALTTLSQLLKGNQTPSSPIPLGTNIQSINPSGGGWGSPSVSSTFTPDDPGFDSGGF